MRYTQYLERAFDLFTDALALVGRTVERGLTSVFGSANARYVKKLEPIVRAIGALEPKYQEMTDAELREQTDKFRKRLAAGETLDDLLVEAFAVCREAGRRNLGMRHFDVQLMGGIVLHRGSIAEMVTGEGKTLVATLPAYLNALEGQGVHIVTVNDYLARRDMEWMGPLYMSLGLTVGAIQNNMDPAARRQAYECDITYGTNNEFGFDYLRDNMRPARWDDERYPPQYRQVQRKLHYAIIDEVDNILIDEARTPLIISGPAHDDISRYRAADQIARQLRCNVHFEVNEKDHTVTLTEEGVRRAEQLAGVESFYTAGNMEWPHLIDNALKAHHLYKRDVNYVVQDGEVVIVDEFTGRLMPGRHWSDGLHQAVEAKENVRIKEENQTLATITLQNFFKLYDKIAGMTGTAMTEAAEFWKIYRLEVIAIPTNMPLRRINHPDLVFRSAREKFIAIVDEIERMHKWDTITLDRHQQLIGTIVCESDESIEFEPHDSKQRITIPRERIRRIERRGRPILVGTVSIENSELVSRMLSQRGVKHQVLNAKHHKREAEIIAQAGRKGAVTIATNMAGRGTDIILGGNPEAMAWAQLQHQYPTRLDVPPEEWNRLVAEIEQRERMKEEGREVAAMGGLHVVGTERHEARRIDLQLRGRCGRQGDPGSSRFFLSLEDDLMRIFAGEWVKNALTWLGMEEGQAIESPMVSRRIEGAQKKVEERNFEVRKNLLEYDEVMDEQRKRVYGFRQQILDGADCKQIVLEMIREEIDRHFGHFLDRDYGTESFAEWAARQLATELDPRDLRGMDFETAEDYAKDQAERMAEGQLLDLVDENLPEDEDETEWNWAALAQAINTRWRLGVDSRDLRRIGRGELVEQLIGQVRRAIQKCDLRYGARFLDPQYGIQTACQWASRKYGIELEPGELEDREAGEIKQMVFQRACQAYRRKEIEFPVTNGINYYTSRDPQGHRRYDREGLAAWAKHRFGAELSASDLRNRQRHEVESILMDYSRRTMEQAEQLSAELEQQIDALYGNQHNPDTAAEPASSNGQLASFSEWLRECLRVDLPAEEIARMAPDRVQRLARSAWEDRFRPEMRDVERMLLLEILDAAWKDHLLVMDHLRSSVGLRGYAQRDPKVEYKREGMKLFEAMWNRVGERVTDAVFRVQETVQVRVSSTWTESQAVHQEAAPLSDAALEQQSAIDSMQDDWKWEPIRNRQGRVGRNDACPCGSGKKYKKCCGRGRR